ncbi:MAG: Ig-like domain-containing protein, partial [Candidatus Aenigmatarchaeota archaeon]
SQQGSLRYNVSWEGKSLEEEKAYFIQTFNYTEESHLEFDLEVLQQADYPWPEPRSAQLNKNYNYSLKVTNIGDSLANNWNVSIKIPESCEVKQVYNSGFWNETSRKITWQLPDLAVYSSVRLNFTLNCSSVGKQVFIAEGIKDTREETSFVNDTNINCFGSSCSLTQAYSFTKPNNARYEKLKEANFLISYEWKGQNVTIGQASVSFADDLLNYKIAWQNYSLGSSNGKVWGNYSIEESKQENYILASRNIAINAYADATYEPKANLTVEKIAYTWKTGKLFEENQELFAKIKVYTYTPLLENSTLYINGDKTRTIGGWGEQFNFSVMVRDRFGRDVTVYAWHRKGIADYSLIGSWICYSCLEWTQVNFSYDYVGSDIGSWDFKFNASNADGTSELSGYGYTVEADEINVYNITPSWNSIVNRSQLTNFVLQVWDRDNQSYPGYLLPGQADEGRGKIFISKFGSPETFDSSPAISANETGHLVRSMQNSSDSWCKVSDYYLGQNYWKGGVSGATTYKDNITEIMSFWLMGDLSNSYLTQPLGEQNFTRGQTINFNGVIKDDCNDIKSDAAKFGAEYRISHGETTYVIVSDLTSASWQVPQDAPLGWYNVTMIAFAEGSEAGKYWNGTFFKENAFFIATVPKLENPEVQPLVGSWEIKPFNFSVFVTSEDGETVLIKLWLKNSSIDWYVENSSYCINCNNYFFLTQKNFTCENIGEWQAKFNASSSTSFTNETQIINFNVTKSAISINYAEGNNTIVNRSDSAPGNYVKLAVQIWNLVLNNYTTIIPNDNVKFWVQTGLDWKEEFETSNETHYYLDFNPSCEYLPGIRKWKVNSTHACYADNSSEEFYVTIIANLTNNLEKPDGSVNYTAGSLIDLNGTIIDDCLQAVVGANVRFKLQSGSNVYYCPSSGYVTNATGNFYNCTWDSSGKPGGWYNVTMESFKDYHVNGIVTRENAFFLITPVELISPQVSPSIGGWGELHNFSVIVNHYANVNVCLLERTPTSEWSVTECKFIENPSNKLVNFTKTYSCEDLQASSLWYFAFNASEPEVPETYSNTSQLSHTLEKNDIAFIYFEGNETQVNRNGSATTKFVLYVNDTDRNLPAYTLLAGSPKPVVGFRIHNGTAYLTDGTNTTNSSGYVSYYFNPSCSYEIGKRNWYAFTSGDSCYKDASSSVFNVTIIGDLVPNITYPSGETYYRTQSLYVNVSGDVRDECNLNYISNALVNFTLYWAANPSVQYHCEEIGNYGNGTYNCTFDATSYDEGWYHVRMNASNVEYYNNGSDYKEYRFKIVQVWQPPVLEDETVLPEQDWGWGENFTFKVNVSDENADDVNVSLWLSPDNQTWFYVGSQICYDCGIKTELTFYYKGFKCSDMPQYYFKFNASDVHNSTDRPGKSFTLTKDDVVIEYSGLSEGNNSWVDRNSGSVLLKVRIYDLDNKSYVPSNVQGKVYVTKDQINYDSGWLGFTDSQGYLGAYFAPNCDYLVGMQYWKAGTYQDSCYKDANSTLLLTTNIRGWLNNSITEPNGEAYLSNENVTIRGNVSDECGLTISDASVTFRIFHTGYNAFSAICEEVLNEGNSYYNCTWNVSSNPSGWYNVEMNSSRDYYNNGTKIRDQVFFHQVNPVLTNEFVSPQQAPWGSTFVFKVNVTDDDDIVNVSLWIRKLPTGEFYLANSTLCSDCINRQVELSKRYTAGTDIGDYEWFINASDLHSGYAETSVKTFNVTKRNTYWIYSQGNNSWVSRIGSNTTMLEARLFDAFTNNYLDKGSDTLYINVTKDGTWGKWSNSSSLGYLTIAFDPDCSYSVGEQKWKAVFSGDAYYYGSESQNFTVYIYSEFYAQVLQPNGEVYAEGEDVQIVGRLRDECLNNIPGAATIFRIYPGDYSCNPEPANDLGNGNYSCTFGTTGLLGWYDISMNSSKNYFNDTYTLKQNAFQVRRKPSITSYQVSPQQEGWGYNFTVSAYLLDADSGDTLQISLWKSYDGTNWIHVSSQVKDDCTSGCDITFNPEFTCSDYLSGPTIYLKLNVSDSYGLKNETSSFTVTLEKDDVSFYTIQAPSSVDREGGVGVFVVRVNDTDKNAWVDDSQENVKGYFWFTKEPSTPTWDSGWFATINSSGYMQVSFDPNCSYAASYQYWKVGILDNNCYADTNSTESGFTIKGQLKSNLYLPERFSQFNVSDLINIRWSVYSDCYGISEAYDSGNITGVSNILNLYNFGNSSSCTDINEIFEGNYNCTWDSTSQPEGNWTINIQVSKANYNSNSTNYTNWFWLENLAPEILEIKVSPEQAGWGSVFNYSVYVKDEENDEVTCLLYVNTTGSFVFKGLNSTSTPGLCNVIVNDFTCQDQSNASFYFIVNDTFNKVNTSEILGITQGPNITKNSLSISLIQGNNAKVNRSDSSIGSTTRFILFVNDTTRNSAPLENTNGSILITYDYSNFYSYFVQTNSSGYLNFDFNPGCEYQTGKQYWIAFVGDACYETRFTNSTPSENYTVEIYGDLNLEIISPKGEKYLRSSYPDGQNVNLTARVTTDCSLEGGVSDALVNFTLTQGLTNKYCSDIENMGEGYFHCMLNTS